MGSEQSSAQEYDQKQRGGYFEQLPAETNNQIQSYLDAEDAATMSATSRLGRSHLLTNENFANTSLESLARYVSQFPENFDRKDQLFNRALDQMLLTLPTISSQLMNEYRMFLEINQDRLFQLAFQRGLTELGNEHRDVIWHQYLDFLDNKISADVEILSVDEFKNYPVNLWALSSTSYPEVTGVLQGRFSEEEVDQVMKLHAENEL